MGRSSALLRLFVAAISVISIARCDGQVGELVDGHAVGGGSPSTPSGGASSSSSNGGGSLAEAAGGGSGAAGGGSIIPIVGGGSAGGSTSADGGGAAGGGSDPAGGGAAGGGSIGGGAAGGSTATTGGGSAGGGAAGGGAAGGGTAGGGAGGGGAAGGGSVALPNFSFFVTSIEAMRSLSGSQNGFGGNLTYGETGPGAGLRGADKICRTIAERAMPGSGAKVWRAFLSASTGINGEATPTNAIERIGTGPWYDRLGRLVAQNTTALLANPRPIGQLWADLPNENGVANRQGTDNHDTITGSNRQGRFTPGAPATSTCMDWTATTPANMGRPFIGHSWPRNAQQLANGGNWMSDHTAPGCGAGVNLIQNGAGDGTPIIGGGGGYGGLFCFALSP